MRPSRLYNLYVGNVGMAEILMIAVIGLLVFGPRRLPEMARQAGRALNEFKRVTGELTEELKAGLDEPPMKTPSGAGTAQLTGTEMLPIQGIMDGNGHSNSAVQPGEPKLGDPPPGKDV